MLQNLSYFWIMKNHFVLSIFYAMYFIFSLNKCLGSDVDIEKNKDTQRHKLKKITLFFFVFQKYGKF